MVRDSSDDVDTKNMPFINQIWIVKGAPEIISKTAIVLPVILFGIFGNVLVIYILIRNPRIRSPTNLLISNMAVADLLSILVHPWVILTYDLFQNYQLGAVGCQGEASLECSVLIASVISMTAITYDRLTAIVLPKETRLDKKGAKIVIAVTWIIAITLSLPIGFYRTYKERQWLDFLEKYCTENLLVINIYWFVIITVLVWLPLTIQIICYISIFKKLNKFEKLIANKLKQRRVSYKKRAAQMMFIIIVTFMICRLPFTALTIYRHQLIQGKIVGASSNVVQVNGFYHVLWFVSKYLIFLNTSLNPLIFGVTNEKFRRAFQTTKLSKWLFPPAKAVKSTSANQKSTPETSSKYYSMFLFFKRKQKACFKENVKDDKIQINVINI